MDPLIYLFVGKIKLIYWKSAKEKGGMPYLCIHIKKQLEKRKVILYTQKNWERTTNKTQKNNKIVSDNL